RAFPTLCSGTERQLLGRLPGSGPASDAAVFRTTVGARARPLHDHGAVRARGETARYRNGYYERDFVTRLGTLRLSICADAQEELSARGDRQVSASGGGGMPADPGSVSTRDQHAAGGTNRSHHEWRSGQSANGVAADSRSGRGGQAVP